MSRRRDAKRGDEIRRLASEGYTDTRIARELGIHRATVARYRRETDRSDLLRQAQLDVLRGALVQHRDDLAHVLGEFAQEVSIPQPQDIRIDSLGDPGAHSQAYLYGRASLSWHSQQNGAVLLSLPVQGKVIFGCLRQHLKSSTLMKTFDLWRRDGGRYVAALSASWTSLRKGVEEGTGLSVVYDGNAPGLKDLLAELYQSACGIAFHQYASKEFREFAIVEPRAGWYQLEADGIPLAQAPSPDLLDRCEQVFKDMLKAELPPRLREAATLRTGLVDLERTIAQEAEKQTLRRTFPGRCDVCPG